MKAQKTRIGGLQIAIIFLTAATAVVHFTLFTGRLGDVMFILNGLGYLGLLAALYLQVPIFANRRGLARVLLMVLAAVTIVAWIAMGEKNLAKGYIAYIGYTDKIVEIVLIILLWLENQRSKVQHTQ
jgi:hypothetical protein